MCSWRQRLTPVKGVQALKVQPASGAVLAWVWKYVSPVAKVGLPETLFACRHLRAAHQVTSRASPHLLGVETSSIF